MQGSFIPPKPNSILIGLFRALSPLIGYFGLNDLQVQFSGSTAQLKAAKRALILPNHPTEDDPFCLVELSKFLGEEIFCLAAREVFDWENCWLGPLMQGLGVYSILRGTPDRESFAMTKQILCAGKQKLVVFIEGEVSYDQDRLLALESGVLALAFSALSDLPAGEKLLVFPASLKYNYESGWSQALDQSLNKMENALALPSRRGEDQTERLQAIAEGIHIAQTSSTHQPFAHDQRSSMIDLQANMREKILSSLERFFELSPDKPLSESERIIALRNTIVKYIYRFSQHKPVSPYEERLLAKNLKQFRKFYGDLERQSIGLLLPPASQTLSPAKLIQTAQRFEKEIFGKASVNAPRQGTMHFAEPIDLGSMLAEYKLNRKETLAKVLKFIETGIREGLKETPEDSP